MKHLREKPLKSWSTNDVALFLRIYSSDLYDAKTVEDLQGKDLSADYADYVGKLNNVKGSKLDDMSESQFATVLEKLGIDALNATSLANAILKFKSPGKIHKKEKRKKKMAKMLFICCLFFIFYFLFFTFCLFLFPLCTASHCSFC